MATLPSTRTAVPTAPDTASPSATPATPATYQIDPAASRVVFAIGLRLFFVKGSTVTGRFADVAGTITLDEQDPSTAQAAVTIGAASVDTRNARRDMHLRTADFFHVDQHPTLTFRSRRVEPVAPAEGRYRVAGDLTLHGVTREVVLEAHYAPALGAGRDRRIALTLTAPLNRRDFEMAQNNPVFKVADDLTVTLTIEATRV